MTWHVIAYQSTELLFGTHTFNFNCFFDDFNCVFTQIRGLSRLLVLLKDAGCAGKKKHCYNIDEEGGEYTVFKSVDPSFQLLDILTFQTFQLMFPKFCPMNML